MSGLNERLISVLIPAYNHERYVERAIRSVLAQEWPRTELVVVDDGSRDGTWDVLQRLRGELESVFERVSLNRQENGGTCVTCNRLRELARGDYAMILASDDELLPGAFRALASALEENAAAGAAVGVNEIMDDDGRRCFWDESRNVTYSETGARYRSFDEFNGASTGVDPRGRTFGAYEELVRVNHVGNGVLFRRSVLDRVPPFTPEAPLEDWWLNLQVAKIARFVHVDDATFRYRWHAANTIKKSDRMRDFFWRTLRWEEQCVEALPDRRFLDAFLRAHREVRTKFALGGVLRLEKEITPGRVRRVLTVFGRKFVLKSTSR